MIASISSLRDACRLLGGLALDGARVALLCEIQHERFAAKLGTAIGGDLGEALTGMQCALDEEPPDSLAMEYTRLMVANGEGGARRPIPVPPWEDCYTGGERKVLGRRSRTALRAYIAAGLGFYGMTEQPADHVGLELCFVAALLDEEERGNQGAESARYTFIEEHLRAFSPAFGRALAKAARKGFWREAGRAIALLPAALSDDANAQSNTA